MRNEHQCWQQYHIARYTNMLMLSLYRMQLNDCWPLHHQGSQCLCNLQRFILENGLCSRFCLATSQHGLMKGSNTWGPDMTGCL